MSRLILCMLICFIISESIHKCHSSIDSEEVRLEILDTAGLVNSFSSSFSIRVKSGKFGHQVNSDTHLQTVEIQMRRLLMSRLIRIFTVCLVNLFFIPITEL